MQIRTEILSFLKTQEDCHDLSTGEHLETTRGADLRLVFVSDVFYPDLAGGFRRFLRYGPFLSARGIEIHVFTTLKPHHVTEFEVISGVSIHRISLEEGLSTAVQRDVLQEHAIEWLNEQNSLPVVFQTMTATATPRRSVKLWRMRWQGMPSIYSMTNVVDPPRGNLVRRWRYRLSVFIGMRPYVSVFVLSEEMRRVYRKRMKDPFLPIEVIGNGVDTERFRPRTGDERRLAREFYGLTEDSPVVLFVGALVERKRVHYLTDAWKLVRKRYPDAILLIVGAQKARATQSTEQKRHDFESYRRRLDESIALAGGEEAVRIVPESDDVRPAYWAADVFALPSESEGMPNVVLEAMACGLPTLVSPFDGIPRDGEEIGFSGTHHVRVEGGPQAWADDIERLVDDVRGRNKMGASAREFIERVHSIDTVSRTLEKRYREIAGR